MPFVALSTAEKTEAHIRKRFKEWCDESGQTQKEAGAAIEWEQQTVSCYFRGEQQIDFMRAITWCEHFHHTIEELLEKSPRTKPQNPKLQKWINIFNSQSEEKQDQLLALGPVLAGKAKKATKGRRARVCARFETAIALGSSTTPSRIRRYSQPKQRRWH